MEASLKVLNNYVKVDDQNPLELAEKITRIGHEVEGHHELAVGTKLVSVYTYRIQHIIQTMITQSGKV
jgi:phenylalanyl-tRNA synthetase beta chain